MTIELFSDQFTAHFSLLSQQARGRLGLNICKMLFFDYTQFLQVYRCPGDADDLLDGILAIEAYIGGTGNKAGLTDALLNVQNLKHHLEVFEIAQGWNEDCFELNCAYEACEAVDYTLSFLLDGISDFVACAATCLLNNVYAAVIKTGQFSEDEVDYHPLVEKTLLFLLSECSS